MSLNRDGTTRRSFLKNSTTSAAAVALGLKLAGGTRTVRGANEKIGVGFIGVGNRGTQLLTRFMKQDDVEIAAICD
ncbi:MAG: twin-arginine translocation signal domain-containing protein, partial [Phycisphaerales bacterium]